MTNPLSYGYSYNAYKGRREIERYDDELHKLEDVLDKFKNVRSAIYNLGYNAEQIDLNYIDHNFRLKKAEFELVFPVIKKLAEVADFITDREYAHWQQKQEQEGGA